MIKLIRGPEPKFFKSKPLLKAQAELNKSAGDNQRQERLRFDNNVLRAVFKEMMESCGNKCAYCETTVGKIVYGDIAQFRPRAGARGLDQSQYAPLHYWWLAYEWTNLLISCSTCNEKYKRDYFPLENEASRSPIGAKGSALMIEMPLLIDPFLDNPEDHLSFEADGTIRELSKKGKVTIEILGLNRTELVKRRSSVGRSFLQELEALLHLKKFRHAAVERTINSVRELYDEPPTREYAAMLRSVFNNWYKKNGGFWEMIMKESKESFKAKKHISLELKDEISMVEKEQVEAQLTTIKRFSIKSIHIKNFKSISDLKFKIPPLNEKEKRESWLLLLGDNGIGKSSILQAIALALTPASEVKKLDEDVLDYLKYHQESGSVTIESYEHDKPITLTFDQNGFRSDLTEAPTFMLGYGSTRLLPKGGIEPAENQPPYINTANLFDYSVALKDPNKWLSQIDPTDFKERVAAVFFDILSLRGKDRIWINEKGKIMIEQFSENTELEDNSDGYKTITALVSDIMQTLSLEKANYHNSQGIVLIDEIGNHLHPRWRMNIAGALRRAFPKLQFIVTTHEPLCLRGLSHGEVAVLIRDEQNTIRSLDKKLLPDHTQLRIDQLLTSDLFGLINVMDEDSEKTYEDYYQLLTKKESDRTNTEKKKIKEYSSQLSEKEMLGSTPQMQALFQLINETYAKSIQEKGFKTKETLKKQTITEVKKYLKAKKLDWL